MKLCTRLHWLSRKTRLQSQIFHTNQLLKLFIHVKSTLTQISIDTSEIIWTYSGTVGYCVAEKKCNFWACLDSYIMHRYFKISFYFETNIKVISLHYYDWLLLTPPAVFYELQTSWLFDLLSQLATQKYFFPMSFNCFKKIDRKWQKPSNF